MADRPRGNGGPEKGTPEYNWLYGNKGQQQRPDDATRAVPRRSRGNEDQTQVMPAAGGGRRGAEAPPRRIAPTPGARSTSGSRLPRPRLRWLWILLVLWLVFLIVVPIIAWTRVDKVAAFPDDDGGRPEEQPGTNYLVVGSDSRGDLTKEERKELGTGNASGRRTDTIMLLHTGDGPSMLMSIPRDSIVEIPGEGSGQKINAAYAFGGPRLLVRTVEANTGIRVDHYVEIGFGGFVDLVDAVGGIEICPKRPMKDKLAKLDIPEGCQEADGPTALGYARSRKTYAARGDIDRARAQREVVSAIGSEALSPWSFLNPVRYYRLNMASADAVRVSEGSSPFAIAAWAVAMTRVNGDSGLTCSVPIADLAVNWDPQRSEQMFQRIREDDTDAIGKDLCTPTGLPR